MEIRYGQEFRFSVLYPILSIPALTLGAMPIPARIITDSDFSTVITSINMTAQSRSSAFFDCRKRPELPSV
jgi:hypothetical protein